MLKEFFGHYFGFTDEIIRLQEIIKKFTEDVKYWQKKAETANDNYYALKSEFEQFQKPVDIPSAEIRYSRPILVSERTYEMIGIDIRNFIMSDFKMEKQLKTKNLIYDGTQDLEELIPIVYHLAKKGYKYGIDKKYGFDEYWMFPYELQAVLKYGKAGDCDDWANLIGSYFVAARIPRSKWLISVGIARAGYGHATVYVKDELGIWRHLNSTRPESKATRLSGFPSNNDKNDMAGIKPDGFWFSYNDKFAVHRWDSEEAREAFKLAEQPIYIKVVK